MARASGVIRVTIRDLKATRLLLWELGEVERELRLAGDTERAQRLDEARARFVGGIAEPTVEEKATAMRAYLEEWRNRPCVWLDSDRGTPCGKPLVTTYGPEFLPTCGDHLRALRDEAET